MSTMLLDKLDYIELDEVVENQFDIDESMEIAIENIDNYEKTELCDIEFEKNIWYIYSSSQDIRYKIDFTKIYFLPETIDYEIIDELIIILKCWIAGLLPHLEASTLQATYRNVINAILETEYFNFYYLDELIDKLNSIESSYRGHKVSSLLNFFDFYNDFDAYNEYIIALINIEYPNVKARKIPSANDVLTFSWVLEDFFNKTPQDDWRYTYYYPLKLWWMITLTIPIRIGEFLSINRNGIYTSNGRYILELKRSKQKRNKKRVQLVDKLEITKSVYDVVLKYIELTEKYGQSETLISYRAYRKLAEYHYNVGNKQKRNPNKMRLTNFSSLLDSFYDKIVTSSPYNLSVREKNLDIEQLIVNDRRRGIFYDIERRLRPNDTRHLAFILLMLQGFHPVEIARLGGHTNIYSQRHYHYHEEFMVDSEVLKIIRSFNLTNKQNNTGVLISNDSNVNMNKEFRIRHIFRPSSVPRDHWDKLEIGYCTAIPKDCSSPCFKCNYWRIDLEEFESKRERLEQWINSIDDKIRSAYRALYNMHKHFCKNDESALNPDISNNINKQAILIKDLLESKEMFKNNLRRSNHEW